MTSVVEAAKRRLRRSEPSVADRLQALAVAVEGARGRLDDALVEDAAALVQRGTGRLALSVDHTVVALAGATGSGKSSLFNALSGAALSEVGRRRPTTAHSTAVTWQGGEPEATEALLDWLDVRRRHRAPATDQDLHGLVLLDLPDHDSTELAHHLEVDRLVALVDMLVWVVDPQKYADAALHERYLRRLAAHQDVMVVALNHVDELPEARRPTVLDDLRRLLVADGLGQVPVLATSARTSAGVPELRGLVARRVSDKQAAAARLRADLRVQVDRLQEASGDSKPPDFPRAEREALVDALAEAAGVPTVVKAVERAVRRRGTRHTGWLLTSWLGRLRPDPLKRLHLDLGAQGKELTGLGRASTPEPTPVQRARVDNAVRATADRVSEPLTSPWVEAVRRASTSRLEDVNDALDRAVVGTDLGAAQVSVWWRLARVLQVLFALATVVGVAWLAVMTLLAYLQLPEPEVPEQYGLPLPTLLLLGGLAGGLSLGVVGRIVNGWVARRRARRAERRLRDAIGEVADTVVLGPIEAELTVYAEVQDALRVAAG